MGRCIRTETEKATAQVPDASPAPCGYAKGFGLTGWIREHALQIISILCTAIVAIGGYAVSLSVDVKVQAAKIEMQAAEIVRIERQHIADLESVWGYFDKVEADIPRK